MTEKKSNEDKDDFLEKILEWNGRLINDKEGKKKRIKDKKRRDIHR